MFRKLVEVLGGLWYFAWGNLFAVFMYDRKYLKGKYFESNYGGILAIGWRWVISDFWGRLLLGTNRGVPFPVSPFVAVGSAERIVFDVDDLHNFQGQGNRFQVMQNGKIKIGKGTYIANNVGIITTNHDLNDLEKHQEGTEIILGIKCWIGMNAMILPGVVLGDHTVVGAGAVVTKSFPEGYCVIAGNPAKKIRDIDMEQEHGVKKSGAEP